MDRKRFDTLTRVVAARGSRRVALTGLLGAVLFGQEPQSIEARCRGKKGKHKRQCRRGSISMVAAAAVAVGRISCSGCASPSNSNPAATICGVRRRSPPASPPANTSVRPTMTASGPSPRKRWPAARMPWSAPRRPWPVSSAACLSKGRIVPWIGNISML